MSVAVHPKKYETPAVTVTYSVSDGGDKNIVFHCHTDYEILYFIRGDVGYMIEGNEYHPSAGSLLLIPPNVMHGVKACGDGTYQRCVLSIRRSGFHKQGEALLQKVFDNAYYFKDTDTYGIGRAFDEIFDATELGPYAAEVAVQALLVKILYMQRHRTASEPHTSADGAIAQIIAYLNRNFTEPLSLDALSSKFFISKHHMNKLFRKYTGITVGEYIIYKRVYCARGLIRGGMRAGDAAERVGFSDYSAFYKAYVKRMGHSPHVDCVPEKE